MELEVSAYSGKFSLSLNKYQLPIKLSETQTLTSGSWHDMRISYDRNLGTIQAYLDGSPIIDTSAINSQAIKTMDAMKVFSDIGEYIYFGSDPDDSNKAFPGAIDDIIFGVSDSTTPTSSATSTASSTVAQMTILPETGNKYYK